MHMGRPCLPCLPYLAGERGGSCCMTDHPTTHPLPNICYFDTAQLPLLLNTALLATFPLPHVSSPSCLFHSSLFFLSSLSFIPLSLSSPVEERKFSVRERKRGKRLDMGMADVEKKADIHRQQAGMGTRHLGPATPPTASHYLPHLLPPSAPPLPSS